ncbi:MAG TPA: DUF58 domain-containing protein [Candidatus Edwardsbacteria bacterium]|nr:DUF58 domain-containing protein [Candidatus Edwardsbacteria bacterium]
MPVQQSLSPELIARIKRLDLKARLVVEGFLTGLHKSPYHGFSVEFAEYRPYMPGDELKRLDWKALARSDRYYVKEFEEETNLKAYLLLDTSASMGYSHGGAQTKLEYGGCLAAALAFLLLSQHDAAGLALFDDRVRRYLPPRSRRSHWNLLLEALDGARPGGRTSFHRIFTELAGRIRRRGLIILVSDLWDGWQDVLASLQHFRHLKHEVLVFHLLDRQEIEFGFPAEATFQDMESGEALQLSPRAVAEGYRGRVREWRERLGRECRQHLIDYVPLATDTPFDQALLQYLHKRQRLG